MNNLGIDEGTVAAVGIVLMIIERIVRAIFDSVVQYRRRHGANLKFAFESTGGVIQSLYELYTELKKDESKTGGNGFHSIRMLSAHNSGSDLNKTMLWKSTVLATWPSSYKLMDEWQEQPLDHEYLQKVLRPVVEGGHKYTRTHDLQPNGPLGANYARQGIVHAFTFLIKKTDAEIVYAAVTFTSQDITADQIATIHQARIDIDKCINSGYASIIHAGGCE